MTIITDSIVPIALFVYDRLNHARRTIHALKQNNLAKVSDLVIFSDAPKSEAQSDKVLKVRQYIYQITGFNSITVVAREHHLGLAKPIIDGIYLNSQKGNFEYY